MIILAKELSVHLRLFSNLQSKKVRYTLTKDVIRYVEATGVPIRRLEDSHASIPKLPVPPLQETLKKYLRSVKPLVTEEEFRITEHVVKTFGAPNGVGEKLQARLEERARKLENWLSEWWLNTAYLDCRASLINGSTAGLVFSFQESHTPDEQLKYAALLIAGALDYKMTLDNIGDPLKVRVNEVIDKSQFSKMFSSCRIPKANRDCIASYGQGPDSPKHIVVAHNNHFFKIIVCEKDGTRIETSKIFHRLKFCIERSTNPSLPVGILTTQNRDVWTQNYEDLYKDDLNKGSMDDIQKGIFLVCIDGFINQTSGCRISDAILQSLHGNGASGNAGNRWYDKTMEFVVGKHGELGLVGEHAPIDGIPITSMGNYLVKYLDENKKVTFDVKDSDVYEPKRLKFRVSPEMENNIECAKKSLESLVQNLEIKSFTFQDFGKIFIKENKLSPDSFIQMAIQLAFYRTHKEPCAQYESASTSKFLHGRTETIRSCSIESVNFSEIMLDPEATSSHKVMALKSAIEAHRHYAKDAVNGHGIDRHLLGLKLTAAELLLEVPMLFRDTSFVKSSHMRMSTSQVPSECDLYGAFAPVVPDGYGCFYNPRKESIYFGLSCFNSYSETNLDVFQRNLAKSLREMKAILTER